VTIELTISEFDLGRFERRVSSIDPSARLESCQDADRCHAQRAAPRDRTPSFRDVRVWVVEAYLLVAKLKPFL
jgi:hypothetical protein